MRSITPLRRRAVRKQLTQCECLTWPASTHHNDQHINSWINALNYPTKAQSCLQTTNTMRSPGMGGTNTLLRSTHKQPDVCAQLHR